MDAAADALAAGMRRQDRLEREASGQPSPFAGAGRGDDALGQALDAVAERFGVPVAAINLVEDERHMQDEDASRLTLLVTERREPLVVHSDAPNPLVGDSLHLQTNGIDLYAGVPLILPDGRCVGALVLLAYEPRPFTPQDVAALGAAADDLVARFAQD
jgi:GAF domain-containing protein